MDSRTDDLFSYIEAYIQKHGYGPSYQEMLETLSYSSKATVKFDLEMLRDQNLVTWVAGKARTVRIVSG